MNIYVHIPFCASRCSYCGFYRNPAHRSQGYTEATKRLADMIPHEKSKTFYLGGGTPTALGDELPDLIRHIIDKFAEEGHELTVESNVSDIEEGYIQRLKKAGTTRISIGVQSYDTDIRRDVGRRSDRTGAIRATETCLREGLKTNVDLMYCLPGQTIDDFISDVKLVTEIGADSMSHYTLRIKGDTPLGKKIDRGIIAIKTKKEELQLAGWDTAERAGYVMLNITNFGKKEDDLAEYMRWRSIPREILPLGSGAIGYLHGQRIAVTKDIDDYIQKIMGGELPFTYSTIKKEGLWLKRNLHKLLGTGQFDLERLSIRPSEELLERLHKEGLTKDMSSKIKLTKKGLLRHRHISGLIIADLF